MRLYFDRVIASVCGASGLTALGISVALQALGKTSFDSRTTLVIALVTMLSLAYLWFEVGRRKNRYGGNIVEEITARAELVRSLVSAETVVFGHTHVPMKRKGYVNLGSFGYGYPKRSFAWLGEDGNVELTEVART